MLQVLRISLIILLAIAIMIPGVINSPVVAKENAVKP
jgi:hypothetical protein